MELDLVRTVRLTLRPWLPSDAVLLKEAIDGSLPELVPWMLIDASHLHAEDPR